jgi:hypothetical protein
MKSGSSSSYRAALSGTGADIGGERDECEPWNPNEVECKTCLGHGHIEDADSGEMRKCLDCSGRGKTEARKDKQP